LPFAVNGQLAYHSNLPLLVWFPLRLRDQWTVLGAHLANETDEVARVPTVCARFHEGAQMSFGE
jgi:hypothetical protein